MVRRPCATAAKTELAYFDDTYADKLTAKVTAVEKVRHTEKNEARLFSWEVFSC